VIHCLNLCDDGDTLKPRDVVIIDNLKAHHDARRLDMKRYGDYRDAKTEGQIPAKRIPRQELTRKKSLVEMRPGRFHGNMLISCRPCPKP
jgi:hypothetical protein